jgi:hypothetical protein
MVGAGAIVFNNQPSQKAEETMEQILINLVGGALGGAGSGKALPQFDMGTILNLIAGLVGGGVLGQLLNLVLPQLQAALQSGNFDIGSILTSLIGGGAGGAILQIIVGAIKNSMAGK